MTRATTGPVPSPDIAIPLRTDEDVIRRIDLLVDHDARQLRSAWLLFVAATGVQLPVVVPIDDRPERPDPHTASSLCWIIAEGLRENVPGGSAIVVLTRPGDDAVTDTDQAWATALRRAARDRCASVRVICLATPGGVRRLT